MSPQPALRVLISGAGIAGPTLALFLQRALGPNGSSITILERAPAPRNTGQNIDIRGFGVDAVQALGLEAAIRAHNTTEAGLRFVDDSGAAVGEFPASGDTEQQSFTSEFEILRGDLAAVVMERARESGAARFVFGDWVTAVEQREGRVWVRTANGKLRRGEDGAQGPADGEANEGEDAEESGWDLLIGADGLMSKTRRLAFGDADEAARVKKMGQYCAFYTVPRLASDDRWAQAYAGGRGRLVSTRPDNYGTTRAVLAATRADLGEYDEAARQGKDAQKALLRKDFADAGWETQRLLDALDSDEAGDFYFSLIAQIRMERFVDGRVALLGDAGFCPSPISGMGTTTALIGAYVLAGEISELPDDIPKALENYQAAMKPYLAGVQNIPSVIPGIANPQSQTGVWILRSFIRAASSSWIRSLVYKLTPATSGKKWMPPQYPKLAQ